MRHRFAAAVIAGLVGLTACGPGPEPAESTIVTGFYPRHHVASETVTGETRVVNLTPPGAEPHDAELTTDQLDAVLDADLVVYIGGGFQPALEEALRSREGPSVDVLA